MSIKVVAGPAGAGKSDVIDELSEPGDLVIDFTLIYNALFPSLAGELRDGDLHREQLRMAQWVKMAALRHAVERGFSGFVTTTRPAQIDTLLAAVGGNRATDLIIVDPGREKVLRRLARDQAQWMKDCIEAVDRWYAAI